MSRDEEVRRALKLYGRVQGVGFRWWARRMALDLGIRGSVRNCYDGTVEVVLAGPGKAVEQMQELLAVGPPGARVRQLEVLTPPDEIPDDFDITF